MVKNSVTIVRNNEITNVRCLQTNFEILYLVTLILKSYFIYYVFFPINFQLNTFLLKIYSMIILNEGI